MTNCVHILRSLLEKNLFSTCKYGVIMKRYQKEYMHSTGSKT